MPESLESEPLWEFGDIGFDTERKLWFIQLTSKTNEAVNTRHARDIKISGGTASQYQWKDTDGRPFWHVRERFFARDVKTISETPGGEIWIEFKDSSNSVTDVPREFGYLLYAYHLTDKNPSDSASPMGFLEFYSKEDELLYRIDKKWIILEGATHSTTGEYPRIRMRIERAHLTDLVVTASCVILRGANHAVQGAWQTLCGG
jgi:hypothetical protein